MKLSIASLLEISNALDKDGQFKAANRIDESIHREIDSSMNRQAQYQRQVGEDPGWWKKEFRSSPQEAEAYRQYTERLMNQDASNLSRQQWSTLKAPPPSLSRRLMRGLGSSLLGQGPFRGYYGVGQGNKDVEKAQQMYLKQLENRMYLHPWMNDDRFERMQQEYKNKSLQQINDRRNQSGANWDQPTQYGKMASKLAENLRTAGLEEHCTVPGCTKPVGGTLQHPETGQEFPFCVDHLVERLERFYGGLGDNAEQEDLDRAHQPSEPQAEQLEDSCRACRGYGVIYYRGSDGEHEPDFCDCPAGRRAFENNSRKGVLGNGGPAVGHLG